MGEPIRMELRMDPPCEDCKAKDAKIARLREGIGTDDGKAHLVARWFMDEAVRLLQAEIARLKNACAQHTKNIRTWMRPGFQSHCTDAMGIMANRAEIAEARVKELERERNHANDIADAAGRKIKELEEALKQAPCQLAISHEMGCPVAQAMKAKEASDGHM